MMERLTELDVLGFLKTNVDVHTMGISAISNVLRECGYKVVIAEPDVMLAVEDASKINNISLIQKWIRDNNISVLGFSYRLDPNDGCRYFCTLYNQLKTMKCLEEDGGSIKLLAFAGLPDTCDLIERKFGNKVIYFRGDETIIESLKKYKIPESKYPAAFTISQPYDVAREDFAKKYIESEEYKQIQFQDHYGYATCGTSKDSFIDRLTYCKEKKTLPIIRVHAGPYSPDRLEAIKEFKSWVKELAASKLMDVLSIGSSQLTQSNFGENWEGIHNGGGVPINSEVEYREIADIAKPMLTRTYSGTKNVPGLAKIHERCLNIAWHALSFWWFCELDGRGTNTVLDNLKEHVEAIKYIASTGKPLEPNVPHHFAFRGSDDVSYIVSAYLAAKTAKKYGITHLILQNMLNTPKYTWGIQDLAKGRVMLKLVRSLEDSTFKVSLQTRAGLDYFEPDIEKAKVQLAAVTALMDDIEPNNPNSPEIIHVVSYSEAIRLATPDVIKESIQITLGALKAYRAKKALGLTMDTVFDPQINTRTEKLYHEAKEAIEFLECHIPNLYSPQGLYTVFEGGFFPVPFILDENRKYPNATRWQTAIKNGGVCVIDNEGNVIETLKRYESIYMGIREN